MRSLRLARKSRIMVRSRLNLKLWRVVVLRWRRLEVDAVAGSGGGRGREMERERRRRE